MAKEYAPPTELEYNADFSKGWEEYEREEKRYEDDLQEFCLKHGEGPYRGEIISTGVADGAARYMVFGTKGHVKLIHIPTGDAWRADPAWIRGVNVAYVKSTVKANKRLAKLFGE